MITRTFKLCLNAGTGSAPYINVSQYDEGETWLFELYSETGERYIPSTGAIVGVKSDGHGIVNTGTVDSEGRVVITETQQMTAAAGRAIFELSIDGLTHGTANFVVAVERKPTDDAVMSDSDLSLIQEAVDAAETIEDLIEGHDPDEVIADAVDAWLDAHPEATTTVEDGAITSAKLNDSVKTGVFEDMTVGTSLAVMNDEGTTDNLAYKFRQTGGDAVRELDEVHGGTIAWNQLFVPQYRGSNGVIMTEGTDGAVILNGTTTATAWLQLQHTEMPIVGHKYFVDKGTSDNKIRFTNDSKGIDTGFNSQCAIGNVTASAYMYITVSSGAEFTNYTIKPQIFDLTQMFGSTVADAIYAMEQSSTGSGVAYFRSLFPNDYYAYNSGELVSVEGLSAHETTESNIFGGDYLADTIVANIPNATKDATNKTVTFTSNYANDKVLYDRFKPNTQYTLILCGMNTSNARGANIAFKYTDGTYTFCEFPSSGAVSWGVFTSTNGKSIQDISGVWSTASTILYYEQCGLFEGVLTEADFKPYKKHTYPLDSTLTLRGVPKWNNGLYFDGDIYRHDGSVSRRYGTATFDGSENWVNVGGSYPQAFQLSTGITNAKQGVHGTQNAMSNRYPWIAVDSADFGIRWQVAGSNGVLFVYDTTYSSNLSGFKASLQAHPLTIIYEIVTPTSETADPYQQYQICDGKGTEEYVSETVTPVGHSTFYPVDIVAKVNKLPSDFSTLIAPTEEGFKATRNYTVNDLLIISNVLYKVTANIANGGTITVNTNVQQTTLGALIKALS